MKIPLGDFGNAVAQAAPVADTSSVYRAASNAALDVADALNDRTRQRRAERLELQNSRARNAAITYRTDVDATTQEIAAAVEAGEISHEVADAELEKRVSAISRPAVEIEDQVTAEDFEAALEQTRTFARHKLEPTVTNARKRESVALLDHSLDELGKQAGFKDANLDAIQAQAAALTAQARKDGLPPDILDRKLQDFQDRNWTNHAQQRLIESSNNMQALKALQKDLSSRDGLYGSKLDPEKRTMLLRGVQNEQDRLTARMEAIGNRREGLAVRTLNAIDQQIASGVPATPEMWNDWQAKVRGTEYEAGFKERVSDEQVIQDVLRKPIGEQVKLVQDREAALLTGGGSVREQANMNRLKTAVQKNVQLLQTAPLLFNANRTGEKPDPIDFSQVGTEAGNAAVAEQLGSRAVALDGMQRQYGAVVPMRPLLPQEADQLGKALDAATPNSAAAMYAGLYDAVGDPKTFNGIMAQVAPDSPVRALAGVLAGKQRALKVKSGLFSGDVVVTSRDVSATILEGESILNATRASTKKDGKPDKGLYLPGDTELQEQFQKVVGDAFAMRAGDADVAWQAVRAYYAGKAARIGRIASNAQDVDGDLVREAVKATIGSTVDYNGRGTVFAPWGMADGEFEDKVQDVLAAEATRRGVFTAAGPDFENPNVGSSMRQMHAPQLVSLEEQYGELGLRQQTGNTYLVTAGRGVVPGADGKPLVITVDP